jgi:hypothetical protein
MTLEELAFGQQVVARVVNIVYGHNEAQIRVKHERGAQLLWVRPDKLQAGVTK